MPLQIVKAVQCCPGHPIVFVNRGRRALDWAPAEVAEPHTQARPVSYWYVRWNAYARRLFVGWHEAPAQDW
jgi:hypothetical protein